MKRFTKVMLAATACLTLSVAQMVAQNATTTDQDKTPDGQHARHMRDGKMGRMGGGPMKMLGEKLALTESQKVQLKSIHEQQRTKMQELRNNESLTKEQKMEQMKALRQSMRSQFNSVLTPDQQTKFAEMKANRKERMGKHRRGHRGAWGDKDEAQKPDANSVK